MSCKICKEHQTKAADLHDNICRACKFNPMYFMSPTNIAKYFSLEENILKTSNILFFEYTNYTYKVVCTRYFLPEVEKLAEKIYGGDDKIIDKKKSRYNKYKDSILRRIKIRKLLEEILPASDRSSVANYRSEAYIVDNNPDFCELSRGIYKEYQETITSYLKSKRDKEYKKSLDNMFFKNIPEEEMHIAKKSKIYLDCLSSSKKKESLNEYKAAVSYILEYELYIKNKNKLKNLDVETKNKIKNLVFYDIQLFIDHIGKKEESFKNCEIYQEFKKRLHLDVVDMKQVLLDFCKKRKLVHVKYDSKSSF